ncbi:trichohyalin isoform X2 [Polyodon spathula]|nr:trichohyalin isoform X2 [Polyodon spathula]
MKMYRDRVESYTEVLQQHQARYAQSPLGQQLLQRQSEREQIEQRIETCDDEIEQRERALQTLRDYTPPQSLTEYVLQLASLKQSTSELHREAALQRPTTSVLEAAINSLKLKQQQSSEAEDREGKKAVSEEVPGNEEKEVDEEQLREEENMQSSFPPSLVGLNNNVMWRKVDERDNGAPIYQPDQLNKETMENETQEDLPHLPGKEDEGHERETEGREQDQMQEEGNEEEEQVYPTTPPASIRVLSSTPTFTLKSPSQRSEEAHSPTFLFSMNSTPKGDPAFAVFECDVFGTGSSHREDSPFSFTSSYFSEKKVTNTSTSGNKKQIGSLFDQLESGGEEEAFEFSFPSKSSSLHGFGKEQGDSRDEFSFSLNFDKLQ